jgi:hypothetical protein
VHEENADQSATTQYVQYAQGVSDPDPKETELPKFLHIISANLDRDPRPAELGSWTAVAAGEVDSVGDLLWLFLD